MNGYSSGSEDTMLPGYLTDTPNVSMLATQQADIADYQTSFVLYNAEPIPGLVRVFWDGTTRR